MDSFNYDQDDKLIANIQNGDESEEAFELLYRKYYKLVLFIANREVANSSDAQDVLQETFLEVRKSIHQLRNPKYFRLWLYRIVDSKCKDLFRSRKFSLVDSDNECIQSLIREEHKEAVPETNMKFISDQAVLMSLINELPQKQRIVLLMYYLEQCSIKEIAEALDIPEGTVKSRMSHAKETLKKKIELYEEKEDIKLSFFSLDAAISTAVLFGYRNACNPMDEDRKNQMKTSDNKQLFTKKSLWISLACTVLLGIGGFAYLQHQNNEATYQNESYFHIVDTGDQVLSNSTEAYFYLLQKACCAEEIERMSILELEQCKEAYQSIKEENSYHYQLLKDMGWSEAYERKMNL